MIRLRYVPPYLPAARNARRNMKSKHFLSLCLMAMLLAACNRSAEGGLHPDDAALLRQDPPQAQAQAQPRQDPPSSSIAPAAPAAGQVIEPVALADSMVAVGSALGAEGGAAGAKDRYSVTDTVYVSVPVGGYPVGTEVTVYWFSANGGSLKTESKPVVAGGVKFVSFTLSQADGMVPGGYMAQVDIGDTPVGMADFAVQ